MKAKLKPRINLNDRTPLVIGDVRQQSMREIWNSERMNALRLQHLEGRRRENGTCGSCGQLTHCIPDNIDAFRPMLLERVRASLPKEPSVQAPGGGTKPPPIAAE